MTRVRRLAAATWAVAAVVLVLPLVTAPSADAQAAPLIPAEALDPALEALAPALEIISPIVYPACADALLVAILPGVLGLGVPAEVTSLLAPLLVVCGAVPEPDGSRVCALDSQARDLLIEQTKPLLGLALPIEVAPLEAVSGFVIKLGDLVPQTGIPLGSTIDAVLMCTVPATTTTTIQVPSSSPLTSDAAPITSVVPIALPTFEELQTLPPVLASAPAVPPAAEAVPLRYVTQPRFRYPIVMGLPLVLLGLGAFLGRALTRPLRPSSGKVA